MTQVVVQPRSYKVSITYQQRNVVVGPTMQRRVVVSIAGPPGPAGTGGFLHTQASPLATWVVNHNLGFRPNVQVYDTGGSVVNAEIVHVSINQCQILFAAPVAGYCRCN